MEKERFDSYNEDVTINTTLQEIYTRLLMELDRFLNDFGKENPELLDRLVEELQHNLQESTSREQTIDLMEKDVQFEILKHHSQLMTLTKGAILPFSDFDKYAAIPVDKNADYQFADALRSTFFLRYHLAASLTAVVSRSKATAFLREYIDRYAEQYVSPSWRCATMEAFEEKLRTDWPASGTHSITLSTPQEGAVAAKIEKCLWHQVMKGLEDPELAYYLACYGDFQMAKFYKENFVLTRTQTLMEGTDYCGFCWHDTRIDKKSEHPSQDFWDNL